MGPDDDEDPLGQGCLRVISGFEDGSDEAWIMVVEPTDSFVQVSTTAKDLQSHRLPYRRQVCHTKSAVLLERDTMQMLRTLSQKKTAVVQW